MKAGIEYFLPMKDYIAAEAINAGLLRTIVDQCPAAAWHQSWLNPARVNSYTAATDTGTIAHGILLEGSIESVVAIDPRDHPAEKTGAIPDGWTNKSIRNARDLARSQGKIPVLAGDFLVIQDMIAAALRFIDSLQDSEPAIWQAFQSDGGNSEATMFWNEGDQFGKLRVDRISTDRKLIIDYKTTAFSAKPEKWARTNLASLGYYVSAAWYRRGVEALFGTSPEYVFLAQETSAPFLCSIVGVDAEGLDLGERKVAKGLNVWQECCRHNVFPAYPQRVAYVSLPPWEINSFNEQEEVDTIEQSIITSQATRDFAAQQQREGLQP